MIYQRRPDLSDRYEPLATLTRGARGARGQVTTAYISEVWGQASGQDRFGLYLAPLPSPCPRGPGRPGGE